MTYGEIQVFTVGVAGTVLYYNGDCWSEMNHHPSDALTGVWGFSEGDVFAVGEDVRNERILGQIIKNKCNLSSLKTCK